MNEAIRNLLTRRSVRAYKQEQIKEEELNQILEVGTYAPTAMGEQSPIMVVVQDQETIQRLSRLNAQVMGVTSDPFYGAPTIVVVFAEKESGVGIQDASLVMGNLMNAAAALGVASCWIHRAEEEFELPEGIEILKDWGIDADKYVGVAHCILGYAKGEAPKAKPRKQDYIRRV